MKTIISDDEIQRKLNALEQKALFFRADNRPGHDHEAGPYWNEAVRLLHAWRERRVTNAEAVKLAEELRQRMV